MECAARALCLRTSSTSGEQTQTHRQSPGIPVFPFLDLPLDLILMITDCLNSRDIAILNQTCLAMRHTLGDRSSAAHLSRTDYLKYLRAICRSQPMQWVCFNCVALHHHRETDLPTIKFIVFSQSPKYRQNHVSGFGVSAGKYYTIRLDHDHVQLALKLARLQETRYSSHIRKLMKPHHDIFNIEAADFEPVESIRVRYSAIPRIVMGADGNPRFLLLTRWHFTVIDGPFHHWNTRPGFLVCPHLRFYDHRITQAVQQKICFHLWRSNRGSPPKKGCRVTGACSRCSTEFCVNISGSGKINLYTWQDLGFEDSPVSLSWRSGLWPIDRDELIASLALGHPVFRSLDAVSHLYNTGTRLWDGADKSSSWTSVAAEQSHLA